MTTKTTTTVAANRRAVLAAAVAATLAGAALPASAAVWDGGSGTWSTSVGHWDGGQVWVQGSDATFGGPAGSTVTLGEAISVGGITYGEFSNGLTIDLNGNNLTQAGSSSFFVDATPVPEDTSVPASSIQITNTSGSTATYTVTAPTATWPRINGNTNVTFNGTGTWIPGPNNAFTGVLTVNNGGQIRTDNGQASIGGPTGIIRLDGTNSLLNFGGGLFETYGRDIEMMNNTVRLASNGVKMITLTGQISGGDLNLVNNQGTIILAGTNTYTGPTNITTVAGAGASLILANSGALGSSTSVNVGSGDPAMLGLMKNPATGGDISLGSGVTLNLTANAPGSGYGMLQNFSGDNTWQGNVALGSNHNRTIGVADGSSLKISGVVGSNADAKGLTKLGAGTLILTGANTYGQSNVSDGTNGTIVGGGTLLLDFSQSSVDSNIINNGPGPGLNFSLTSNRSSQLVLSGGTLEVKGGGAGDTNVQSFSNRSANSFTINPGESRVVATQNGATSLTINVGRLMENSNGDTGGAGTNPGGRHQGGTVDFTLPTAGGIVLGTAATGSAGTSNAILTSNGTAFATVGGNDWAGIDASRNIVGLSTLGGYTANSADALSGNADMSGGVDTTLAADATTTSLRFHNSGARGIDLGGNALTTGGILVTASGNGPTSISNGTLRGAVAGSVIARQDLVVIQRNTADDLTIGATIADNTNPTALTKAGAGTLTLTAANTYTGPTMVTGGVLKLNHASALGGAHVVLKGGVIGLTEASGDFTRALGTAPGELRWYTNESQVGIGTGAGVDPITGGSGGFAAYGGTRIVNIGGATTPLALQWGRNATAGNNSMFFIRGQSALILGADDADGTVNFANPINLANDNSTAYIEREVEVRNGSAAVDAILSGVLSSNEMGLTKTGAGTLELSAANTYDGNTTVNEGALLVTGSLDTNSPVSVNSGAALGGHGAVGRVNVNPGGAISPDRNGSDNVFSVGSLTLGDGSASLFNIDGTGAGTDFDTIGATGHVTFGGDLFVAFSQDFGDGQWDLFNFATSSGDFGSVVDVTGRYADLSFDPATGILSTSAIPEPAAAGVLALAAGAALLGRRRRAV